MIVRIFNSKQDSNFGAVEYNEEKIEKNKGELMSAKNIPEFVNVLNSESVKDYMKSIKPNNDRMKNFQFHAVISTKGTERNKDELNLVANDFMKNLGYGSQPFIVVSHNDSKNNHVHIVSTNVNVETRDRMNTDFLFLKSQVALNEAEKNILGIDYDKKLEKLFEFKFTNISQFEKLLKHNGYNSYLKDEHFIVEKNGVALKKVPADAFHFSESIDKERAKQIKAILTKYKDSIDNNVFGIVDKSKIENYNSLLQKEMKNKFGIDILFSFSDDKKPFGYILIDNKNKNIFKGSDVVDMKNIFNFTDVKIEKRVFEFLENSHFKNEEKKDAFKFYLESKFNLKADDYLFDFGKKIPYNNFKENRNIINGFCKGGISDTLQFRKDFSTIKVGDNYFVVNERDKFVFDLKEIVNDKNFVKFESRLNERNEFTASDNTDNINQEEKINSENKMSVISDLVTNSFNSSIGSNENDNSNQTKRKRKNKFKR